MRSRGGRGGQIFSEKMWRHRRHSRLSRHVTALYGLPVKVLVRLFRAATLS